MSSWAEAIFVLIGALTAAIVAMILILVISFMVKIAMNTIKNMVKQYKRKTAPKKFDQEAFMRDVEKVMDINYSLTYAEAEEIIKFIRRNTK